MSMYRHFYSPGGNTYYTVLPLWAVARKSIRHNGMPWLEPQWSGGGEQSGLCLYVSRLDATITATLLNENEEGEHWSVYPFIDMNITEMMIDLAQTHNKNKFNIMLCFGFAIDDFRRLIKAHSVFRLVQFCSTFNISDTIRYPENPAILKFSGNDFDNINKYWAQEFKDYIDIIASYNDFKPPRIADLAKEALEKAAITCTPVLTGENNYTVSSFSITKREWIVSSLDINGATNKIH